MLRALWILVGLLALACLFLMLRPDRPSPSSPTVDEPTPPQAQVEPSVDLPSGSASSFDPVPPATNRYLAGRLSAPPLVSLDAPKPVTRKLVDLSVELGQGGPTEDLHVVQNMFRQFQRTFKENPVGENYEITATLLGANAKGIAYLPFDHARLNERGELCDEWGNPYWFHSQSRTEMEIVSRGPDGKLHTDDDLVLK